MRVLKRVFGVLVALAAAHAGAQTPNVLHTFTGADGAQPVGQLTELPDGSLVGVTNYGGANSAGAIWKLAPAGTFTVLHSFDGLTANGGYPAAGVVIGPDGNMYGTAGFGGNGAGNGYGLVYKIDSSGNYSVVHALASTEGYEPDSDLAVANDGTLWGETTGTLDGNGSIFKVGTDGSYTVMHDFTNTDDGMGPVGGLLQASDGNFYGVAANGGTHGFGTLFQITPSGTFTVLWNFTNGADGGHPCAKLEEVPDGTLWGSTMTGGAYGYGTNFEANFSGNVTTTFNYNDTDGDNPNWGDFLAGNGMLFGMTNEGGAGGYGTANWFSPSSPTNLGTFSYNGVDGASPAGGIFQAVDGNLYTTTQYGQTQQDDGFLLQFPQKPALPALISIAASAHTISFPQGFNLTWNLTNAYSMTRRQCYAFGEDSAEWFGPQAPTGSETLYPRPGTYHYEFECGGILSAEDIVTVDKAATTTVISGPSSVVRGASVSLTITVSTGLELIPTGNVELLYNGQVLTTLAMTDGTVTYNGAAPLTVGSYTITAVYLGNDLCEGSTSAPFTVKVTKDPTTTTLSSSVSGSITQGQPLVLSAAVSGGPGTQRPTGSVTFYASLNSQPSVELATVQLNNQQIAVYNVDTSIAPAGSYSVTAEYNGDSDFATSLSSNVTFKILGATTISPGAQPNPVVAGTNLTLSATVASDTSPTPTGVVDFQVGGSTLLSCDLDQGSCSVSETLTPTNRPGVFAVMAVYSGDDNHGSSSSTFNVTVIGATTTALALSPSSAAQGQRVTFTSTVTAVSSSGPTPTGTVKLSFEGTNFGTITLNNGAGSYATVVPNYVGPGTYTITATYSGDSNYAGSTGTAKLTVTQ